MHAEVGRCNLVNKKGELTGRGQRGSTQSGQTNKPKGAKQKKSKGQTRSERYERRYKGEDSSRRHIGRVREKGDFKIKQKIQTRNTEQNHLKSHKDENEASNWEAFSAPHHFKSSGPFPPLHLCMQNRKPE